MPMTSRSGDQQIGAVFRAIRLRRRLRQADLSRLVGVSRSIISRIERGHLDGLSLKTLRRVAAVLEVRIDLVARWRAGDLDRILSAAHSELHEAMARLLGRFTGWTVTHEVTYAYYAERGVIDIVAWHPGRRAFLLIELKTEITDVNDLLAQESRRKRLARRIAIERGWHPLSISSVLVVVDTTTNRRRVAAHQAVLRSAFPGTTRQLRPWLAEPNDPVSLLVFWPLPRRSSTAAGGPGHTTGIRRIRLGANGASISPCARLKSSSQESPA